MDFVWFRRDRNLNGGGVVIAVKAALSPVRRPDLEPDCESVVVQIGSVNPRLTGLFP